MSCELGWTEALRRAADVYLAALTEPEALSVNLLIATQGIVQDGSSAAIAQIVDAIATHHVKRGHRVTIVTRMLRAGDREVEDIDGIRIYRYESVRRDGPAFYMYPAFSIINGGRTIARVIRREAIDLIKNAGYM